MPQSNRLLAHTEDTHNASNKLELPLLARALKPPFNLFCHFLYSIYCPLTVSGREHLPKTQFIICSNHSSHMDTTALIYATKLGPNRFSALAAQDYFFSKDGKLPLSAHLLNLIPVSRQASRQSLQSCIDTCKTHIARGQNFIIYPEGTRSTDGQLHELKNGAAFIAAQLRLPIVPAFIHGTFAAMPKGNNLIRPKKIIVKFGEPINTYDPSGNSKVPYKQITQTLKNRIIELKESTIV